MAQATNIKIGSQHPCFIIAEIAQAHDGSLGNAHAYIDALAECGVNAVKFQMHIAEAESTLDEPFRVTGFPQDETRYDYWRRMEFSFEQWQGLKRHAEELGLVFLCTPFSLEAVEQLEAIGVVAYKIGSAEIEHHPLLKKVVSCNKPILLSSGLSTWAQLDEAVALIATPQLAGIFQCTSSYPCPPEQTGLNVLGEIQQRYGCVAGLSDHSGEPYAALAAVTLGAKMLEVHATFSPLSFGPDTASSLTIEQIKQLVKGVRLIETSLNNPVDKNALAQEHQQLNKTFGKTIVAKHDLVKNQIISEDDIAYKKPLQGIAAKDVAQVIKQKTQKAYRKNECFQYEDFS